MKKIAFLILALGFSLIGLSQSTVTPVPGSATFSLQALIYNKLLGTLTVTDDSNSNFTWDDSSADEASSVSKSSAGTLYGFTGTCSTAQYIHFYNSTTVPADGATPLVVIKVPADESFSWNAGVGGKSFSTGISWANSSTKAIKTIGSSNCMLNVKIK